MDRQEAPSFDDKLSKFKKFLDTVRGVADIKGRFNAILNPDNPFSSSKLVGEQIDFVATSCFVADYFPEFQPLKDYAEEVCRASISGGGWGVESVIRLEQALGEKRMLELGLKQPEEKKGFLSKGEKKEKT